MKVMGLNKAFVSYCTTVSKRVCQSTANSKPVKQEVNSTVILPTLVFPAETLLATVCTECQINLMMSEERSCFNILHGQNLAYRTSLGPSFQF